MSLVINVSRDDTYNCKDKIINRKIDACKLGDTVSTAPLISLFFKTLMGSIDGGGEGVFKCPMRTGRLVISNLSYDGFLPFKSNTKICFEVKTLFRLEKTKNFIVGMVFESNVTYY